MKQKSVGIAALLILVLSTLRAQDPKFVTDSLKYSREFYAKVDEKEAESPTPASEFEEEILYQSPKGTYRIQASEDGTSLWVVSTKDPAQRKVLPGASPGDKYGAPHFSASPNEKWLFDDYENELYQDTGGLTFSAFKKKEWFWKNAVIYASKNFHFPKKGLASEIAGWSCDSSRLLIALSSEDEERYIYFNTRTNVFEQTPYLRMVNKMLEGAKGFDAFPGATFARGSPARHMVFGEPIDAPASEAVLKASFEELDAKMSKLHKEYLEQADADVVLVTRDSQQQWVKAREQAVEKYLPFAPKAGQERFRLQFLCDLTGEEIRQLEEILKPAGAENKAEESTSPSPALADKILCESPNGSYRVVTNEAGRSFWVVSTKDPSQRNLLPGSAPGHHPEFRASPDEKWLFADYFGLSELYENKGGLRFAPFKQEQWFSKNAEAYAAKNFHLTKKEIYSRGGGWSFDSSRLLILLQFYPDLGERCLYFNMRTETLEETPYLRMVNKTLAEGKDTVHTWAGGAYPSAYFTRWLRYMVFVEPMDTPPSEDVLKTRFDAADQKMNKLHEESLVWISNEQTKNDRRSSYQKWTRARDDGVKMYLPFAPKTEEERYRLQFLCDLTEEEIREAKEAPRESESR